VKTSIPLSEKSSERYANLSPYEAAEKILPKSTGGTIKGDQKFDPLLWLIIVFFVIGVPAGYLWVIGQNLDASAKGQSARKTAIANGTVIYRAIVAPNITPLPTATKPVWMGSDGSAYLTATLQPTPTPTKTRVPENTPTSTATNPQTVISSTSPVQAGFFPGYTDYYFMFSYYYPPLLGVNCHPDNVLADGECKDITSSGRKWSEWVFDKTVDKNFRGGVAVPMSYPLGIVFSVSYPESMKGDYLAVDYCPACDDYPGVTFLDFLAETKPVQFWQPIKATIRP
jgi:hypothetical protein